MVQWTGWPFSCIVFVHNVSFLNKDAAPECVQQSLGVIYADSRKTLAVRAYLGARYSQTRLREQVASSNPLPSSPSPPVRPSTPTLSSPSPHHLNLRPLLTTHPLHPYIRACINALVSVHGRRRHTLKGRLMMIPACFACQLRSVSGTAAGTKDASFELRDLCQF